MKPQKLTICGWGPYKDRVEIDFDKFQNRGLFLITGATGAGKTTLFDAISYALYGALSGEVRDKDRSSVRSDFAALETPTYVELEMIHAGKEYRILRNPEYMRLKKNASKGNPYTKEKENAVLYLPNGEVVEGVKEVNAYIRELLALDYNQFKQLSMIAQGEFARLLTAAPKDKTKIFREIFGTGIYERFTSNLATSAKKAYVLMMEQKNKLEEDLRLLASSVQNADMDEAMRDAFLVQVNAEYPNYEQIGKSLEILETGIGEKKELFQKEFAKAEKEIEKKNALLIQKKEENKRIIELQKALEKEKELEEQKKEYQEKSLLYQKAVNAGWVEAAEVNCKQVQERLKALVQEKEEVSEAIEKDRLAVENLKDFWIHREECKNIIENLARYEALAENINKQKKLQEELLQQLAQGRTWYFEKETDSLKAKQSYEDALRIQKYAAIGVAASMLEAGKPCPVCGSTEHPEPAKETEGLLSDKEIEKRKAIYEAKEEESKKCHAKVVMLQTKEEELSKRLEEEEGEAQVLKEKLEQVVEPVCIAFLKMPADVARQEWQNRYGDMQRLQTLVEQRTDRFGKLTDQLTDWEKEKLLAREKFEALLLQYGFWGEEEYYQASLKKEKRDALEKELEQYQRSVNATKDLIAHLKQIVKSEELFDVGELEQDISQAKNDKEKILKNLKYWEQLGNELKRTRKLFVQKQEKIEEQQREYGRIKELENIASGNNKKKLVFEQYVLAGYFEQILLAANIRFRKMTLGRYEMYRTKEVGDGRVKDNLEIEVMDYYTGKARSVRTLSGGESFKASLSLALGLSDIIQAMNGGIKVDTLFIDEGFGALDSESLDQACATLMGLVESERLIGIISHVPELKERIDKQIVIEKTGSGSSLKVVVN